MTAAETTSGPYDHHRGARPLLRRTRTLRGVFFVATTLVGFVAVNAFLHYLATGRWLDLSLASYRQLLGVPLSEMLIEPLSIFTHPWMIPVTGLLVGTVVFVPISAAVLYRLWVSGVFVAAVAVIGHAPLLASALAAGCVLAGRTRLRSDFPFLALLAGLVPVVAYLYFFSHGAELMLPPLQRVVLLVPLILALVVAVVAGGVVLMLARVTRYRPGVIWPVLLVLLAAPGWLFYWKVGTSELEYALLAGQVAGEDSIFSQREVRRIPVGPATSAPGTRPTATTTTATATTAASAPAAGDDGLAAALALAQRRLQREQRRLLARCRRFVERYPASPRAPAVMWIIAQAADIRVDARALAGGSVRYAHAGPTGLSIAAWRDLTDRFRRSPQATIANYCLGIDALRTNRAAAAWEHLNIARQLLLTHLARSQAPRSTAWAAVFAPRESLPGRQHYQEVLQRLEELIWLVEANKIVDGLPEDRQAFAEYMQQWPFRDASPRQLEAWSRQPTELADNFAFQAALAEPSPFVQATRLAEVADGFKDGAIAANFELGRLALRLGNTSEWPARQLKPADYYFKQVVKAPENPYHATAAEHLARLARRKERPGG